MFEIALQFDTDAYRTVYAVQIGRRVYLLHAFQKKSNAQIGRGPDKQGYRQALKMEGEE